MTLRDLYHNALVKTSLAPSVRVNGAVNGTSVDLRGYDAALVSVAFGAYTDGTHTPSLEHSVDGATFSVVAASDMNGSFAAVNSSGGANTIQSVGYLGQQRYVRVVMTVTGATSGAASYAGVVVGQPRSAPVV